MARPFLFRDLLTFEFGGWFLAKEWVTITALCSKFLFAQMLFLNSNFNLESKAVFRTAIQVLEL